MHESHKLIQATRQFAADRTARSWWHIISTGFLLLASLAGTLWNFHWLGRLACSVLAGLLVLRMFVIYHDQQHLAILPKSKLAEVLMRVFGILALSPSSIWRSSHNYHHNHNSKLRSAHIGSFPVMTKAQYLKSSRRKRFNYLFMRHPLTILFGYLFVFLHGMCLYPFFNNPRKHYDCLIALVVHAALCATLLYFTGWQGLMFAILIPGFIAFGIGSYLFYAQHNFPDVTFNDNAGWTYERAALESSSFLNTNPLMAWFTANIGYHHIHHLNARIPFYRLPEAFANIPELQSPRITSLSPVDIFRCLRLKVWDVDAQRLIPLSKV
jgi:omega-6 fatty acid desaturase (delta-12 desaturase)